MLYGAEGKDTGQINPFFEGLGEVACAPIKTVVMDKGVGLYQSTKHTAAAICINRFHVASLLNQVVNQVRRAEQQSLAETRRQPLEEYAIRLADDRGADESDPIATPDDTSQAHDLKVAWAWLLKEQVNELWKLRDQKLVRRVWQTSYMSAICSWLVLMVKVAKAISEVY